MLSTVEVSFLGGEFWAMTSKSDCLKRCFYLIPYEPKISYIAPELMYFILAFKGELSVLLRSRSREELHKFPR
jgi:hypothetical protein